MAPETATKTLHEMQEEIEAHCRSKGFYDKPVSFGEAMALLHSEVSEALEAWRIRGLDTYTTPEGKPDDVASEFADVFIRLVDYCARFGVDLEAESGRPGDFAISVSFPENIYTLHALIAHAAELFLGRGPWRSHAAFGDVLGFLTAFAADSGIDLYAEYRRKMEFNRCRPYRHGKRN